MPRSDIYKSEGFKNKGKVQRKDYSLRAIRDVLRHNGISMSYMTVRKYLYDAQTELFESLGMFHEKTLEYDMDELMDNKDFLIVLENIIYMAVEQDPSIIQDILDKFDVERV